MSDSNHLLLFIDECHKTLLEESCGEVRDARKYLQKRNLSKESIIIHKIGYCPIDTKIPNEIKFYGRDMGDPSDNGYSYFINGRLIVPVFSEFGKNAWFATRKPTFDKGETWWNLPKPFHKGNHLFLLDKTRKNIFENNKIYVVEGYMDALLLYQEGLPSVVGLMGTHLSPRKIGLISRYCNDICLCLDVDENQSGQKALEKAIYTLKEFGFYESLSVIDQLPIGEDPDEYVVKNGLKKFMSLEKKLSNTEIKNICKQFVLGNKNKKWQKTRNV